MQMTQPTQPSMVDLSAEPMPNGPVRRARSEPALLAWLVDALIGDLIEIFDAMDPDLAIGRGEFGGLTVLGIRLSTPIVAIVFHITWYDRQDVLRRMPGLRHMPLAGPLQFPVGTHMLRPLPAPGRWATIFTLHCCPSA
jgi:hypothetical protein